MSNTDYQSNFRNSNKHVANIATSPSGAPIGFYSTLTVGKRGPVLLQDTNLIDDLAHFSREKIPERIVHAKGAGAFGYFEVTHDISDYTCAKVFAKIGKRTPIAARFSTVGGESGSADTMRDPRGFALKFYTEDGILDIVGNNTPIFFIRDPIFFTSYIHSQKRNPVTHLRDPNMVWDFVSLRPESTHQTLFHFSDRGIPNGYRFMNGYGSHTYKLINAKGVACYCKFHFKSAQGIRNLTAVEARSLRGSDSDYAINDLYNAIAKGDFPSWNFFVQIMSFQQAEDHKHNPFDLTKVWFQKEFPLIPVGRLTLDRNPRNYFAEVEQIAFSPSHLVPGIEVSPDKMLQARLFAYNDAQRYRLGANFLQIPVNCPYRTKVKNYHRDGPMNVTDNQGGAPNYFPNTLDGPMPNERFRRLQKPYKISGDVDRFESRDDDNFSQAKIFWSSVLDDAERKRLVTNMSGHLSLAHGFIQERAISNFYKVSPDLGEALIEALKLRVSSKI